MMVRNIILALLVLVLSADVIAASNKRAAKSRITSLQNWPAYNGIFIKVEGEVANPKGCSYPVEYFLGNDASKTSRALLNMAYNADLPVEFVISGNECSNHNRPVVAAIKVVLP